MQYKPANIGMLSDLQHGSGLIVRLSIRRLTFTLQDDACLEVREQLQLWLPGRQMMSPSAASSFTCKPSRAEHWGAVMVLSMINLLHLRLLLHAMHKLSLLPQKACCKIHVVALV